ncbi:MAG: hypothetical protein JNK15_02920 [Planctomycetes bacterium]|nr:hypothetical protein [Planctomycetota bacterium]
MCLRRSAVRSSVACGLAFAALAPGAAAQSSIPIANAGFEQPAIAAGTFATLAPPAGWNGYGALNFGARTVGVLHPATTTLYTVPPPEGNQVGVVFLMDNPQQQLVFTDSEAGLQQTLAAVLEPNRRYVLSVAVGNIGVDANAPFLFAGFPGYRVELQAGGVPLATDLGTVLPTEAGFATTTVVVDVGANHPLLGQPLRIRLGNRNAAPGIEVNFDDVRLTVQAHALWSDLGQGLPGAAGLPLLTGTGTLSGGVTNALSTVHLPPSGIGVLVLGFAAQPQPLFGGTLVPTPDLLLMMVADATGGASFPFTLAATPPSGSQLVAQHWVFDGATPAGLAASNAVRALLP